MWRFGITISHYMLTQNRVTKMMQGAFVVLILGIMGGLFASQAYQYPSLELMVIVVVCALMFFVFIPIVQMPLNKRIIRETYGFAAMVGGLGYVVSEFIAYRAWHNAIDFAWLVGLIIALPLVLYSYRKLLGEQSQ